jgi:formate hydrogenlyase subunit 3/multisubunit Na+/H+ antiporter MnhD subunit
LTAIFLVIIAVVSPLAAFFSIQYMDHYPDYSVAGYYPLLLLFVMGMYSIISVTDTMTFFFVAWQVMTIPAWALIRYEHKKPENIRAANKFLLIMEIACLLIMLGALVLNAQIIFNQDLAGVPRFDFDALHETALEITNPVIVPVALLLMLVGFGIKAGLWPFGQIWLPDAHPAAPSPVSALLSGVMIKTGVYGIIRVFLWLAPAEIPGRFDAGAWGTILASFGTLTLFIGTLQALKQEETKRLLAFHSIGQVGYIVLAVGVTLVLYPNMSTVALASIALAGAFFHTLNHALFKSLLFFNAGSILFATGTQNLNRIGGLAKFMPLTAWTALVASFSIAGVPLFNGFASKWSIYAATILGAKEVGYLAIFGLFGMVTSAITLASFMKFYGVSFLSRVSDDVRKNSEKRTLEAGPYMQIPQVFLAALCILLGMFPSAAYIFFGNALDVGAFGVVGALPKISIETEGLWKGLSQLGGDVLFMPLVLAGIMLLLFMLARLISKLGSPERKTGDAWLCGYDREADIHRYTAHNLYGEFKKYFSWVGGKPKPSPKGRQ